MMIYDEPRTLYVSGRGWVTGWTEVGDVNGGIVKRGIERPATDDEVFVAQMDCDVIKCPKCKSDNVQYANPVCDDVFVCKDCEKVFSI